METREDSLSRISRKCSKSLYRLRTDEDFNLKAGILVCMVSASQVGCGYSADDLVICVHLPSDTCNVNIDNVVEYYRAFVDL